MAGVLSHGLIVFFGKSFELRAEFVQRSDGDANVFGSDKVRNSGFFPDDDRKSGGQVQGKLVRIVEPQVVAKVSGTGLDGRAVPDESEISPEFPDEFVRQERTLVEDVVLTEVLVSDAVELEPDSVDLPEVVQVDAFLGRQVAGDDDAIPLPVFWRFASEASGSNPVR